jgi:hypothetical protein
MKTGLHPWQLLLLILAGWINRQQQDAIEYLLSENRVLREKLGKKRILLSDEQRMRLAIKGKILGRKLLEQLAGIVTRIRFYAGIGNSWPGSGIIASSGRKLGGRRCQKKLWNWFCALPAKARAGAMTEYRGRWTIWDTAFQTRRSATF